MGKKANGDPLRIRMYRVGFGDFFLLTVPADGGPQHVLIDCGVTKGKTGKGDIGTIKTAVAAMAKETGGKLALIVVTHRHMDHIIGFSRCADDFRKFEVGAVWMPYWETEYDAEVSKFQLELTSLAMDVQQHLALAAAEAPERDEMLAMLENATGAAPGGKGTGGGSNADSLRLLKTELKVKPEYYSKGQNPRLPEALAAAGLEAEILGPPPKDAGAFLKLMDLKKGVGQYLDAASQSLSGSKGFHPFGGRWDAKPEDYPPAAFQELCPRDSGCTTEHGIEALRAAVNSAQPAVLLTAVKQLDAFLNNQSLVVLFTFRGKKLLFAGDAQGGNWEYWLFGGNAPASTPQSKLGAEGSQVLGAIDFYKVGHHGSTNATPIAAVNAMRDGFAAMCSTQADSFGNSESGTEVPRGPLLDALGKKSALVRSDQIAGKTDGKDVAPAVSAKLPKPAAGRFEEGDGYVDYFL